MKNLLGFLLLAGGLFSFTFATVGGPSFVSDIYYHEGSDVYRYALADGGGRGGYLLYEYNMDSNKESIIQQDNENFDDDGWFMGDQNALDAVLSAGGAVSLQELRLANLPISFELRLTNFYKLDENYQTILTDVYVYDPDSVEYFMPGYISAYVWQNRVYRGGDLQRKTELTTCRLDSINYRGFSLPGKNFVIVKASVSKSNCFEGGYIGESIFPVKYVDLIDAVFLDIYTDIVNYENFDGQGPAMNQTTGGIFIELSEEDFQKGLNKNWEDGLGAEEGLEIVDTEEIENVINEENDNDDVILSEDNNPSIDIIENDNRFQNLRNNIKNWFEKVF